MSTLKIPDQVKKWHRFRQIALLFLAPVLILTLVFLVSYFSGRKKLDLDEVERVYYLHVPKTKNVEEPYPVVFVFHMRMGTAWMMEQITHFNRLANKHQFIVVYPDGYGRSWADGSKRYEADKAGIDDVQFIKTLLSDLDSTYEIDRNRIYAAGFSNGGFFTHRLGCELSGQFAAIATVSGVFSENVLEECAPEKNLSVLMLHGSTDQDMPWDGKPPDLASVPASVGKWLEINQCSLQPITEIQENVSDSTSIEKISYPGCSGEAEVVLYKIVGGGHRWPGGRKLWQFWLSGNYTEEIDASNVIWEFFEDKTSGRQPIQ